MLSLFRQHVRQLIHLDPQAHIVNLTSHQEKVMKVELAAQEHKGPLASKFVKWCFGLNAVTNRRDFVKESIVRSFNLGTDRATMKKAAFLATRSIYGVVLLSFLTIFGVALIGWTISWNSLDGGIYFRMTTFLELLTVLFEITFTAVAIFLWDANRLAAYTDVAISLVAPLSDLYWFQQYNSTGTLTGRGMVLYTAIIGYMTIRLWSATVKPRHCSWRTIARNDGLSMLERLDIVWVTRSASQVSEILPDINNVWDRLVSRWGNDRAEQVCRIAVYVTDSDKSSTDLLRLEIRDNSLNRKGWIRFERPDFHKIIEDYSLDLISTRRNSYSLLAFCGSPSLGQIINEHKISNDMVVAMTGNKKHQMEFVTESYGGVSPNKAEANTASTKQVSSDISISSAGDGEGPEGLTTHTHVQYERDQSTLDLMVQQEANTSPLSLYVAEAP